MAENEMTSDGTTMGKRIRLKDFVLAFLAIVGLTFAGLRLYKYHKQSGLSPSGGTRSGRGAAVELDAEAQREIFASFWRFHRLERLTVRVGRKCLVPPQDTDARGLPRFVEPVVYLREGEALNIPVNNASPYLSLDIQGAVINAESAAGDLLFPDGMHSLTVMAKYKGREKLQVLEEVPLKAMCGIFRLQATPYERSSVSRDQNQVGHVGKELYIRDESGDVEGVALRFFDQDGAVLGESPVIRVALPPVMEWHVERKEGRSSLCLAVGDYNEKDVYGFSGIGLFLKRTLPNVPRWNLLGSLLENGGRLEFDELKALGKIGVRKIAPVGRYRSGTWRLGKGGGSVSYEMKELEDQRFHFQLRDEVNASPGMKRNLVQETQDKFGNIRRRYKDVKHPGRSAEIRYFSSSDKVAGNLMFTISEDLEFSEYRDSVKSGDGLLGRICRLQGQFLQVMPGDPRTIVLELKEKENGSKRHRFSIHTPPTKTVDLRLLCGTNRALMKWTPPKIDLDQWETVPTQVVYREERAGTAVRRFTETWGFLKGTPVCVLAHDVGEWEDTNLQEGKTYRYQIEFAGYQKQQILCSAWPAVQDISSRVKRLSNAAIAIPASGPLRIGLKTANRINHPLGMVAMNSLIDALSGRDEIVLLNRDKLVELYAEHVLTALSEEEQEEEEEADALTTDLLWETRTRKYGAKTWFDIWEFEVSADFERRVFSAPVDSVEDGSFDGLMTSVVARYKGLRDLKNRSGKSRVHRAGKDVAVAVLGLQMSDAAGDVPIEDLLSIGLGSMAGLRVVDRAEIDSVLAEQELSLSGLVGEQGGVCRAGKLIGADLIVTGAATSSEPGVYKLSLQFVRAANGEVVGSGLVDMDIDKLEEAVAQLAVLLRASATRSGGGRSGEGEKVREAQSYVGRGWGSEEAIRSALFLVPNSVALHVGLASVYRSKGKLGRASGSAKTAFMHALKGEKESLWTSYCELCVCYFLENGDPEGALRCVDILKAKGPFRYASTQRKEQRLRGLVLVSMGRMEESEKVLGEHRNIYELGVAYEKRGLLHKAADSYARTDERALLRLLMSAKSESLRQRCFMHLYRRCSGMRSREKRLGAFLRLSRTLKLDDRTDPSVFLEIYNCARDAASWKDMDAVMRMMNKHQPDTTQTFSVTYRYFAAAWKKTDLDRMSEAYGFLMTHDDREKGVNKPRLVLAKKRLEEVVPGSGEGREPLKRVEPDDGTVDIRVFQGRKVKIYTDYQTYVAKDRKSGEKLWSVQPWEEELEVEDKRRYRRSVTITEVFSKSILFRRPYCGILVCVEMATGRVQWRFDVLVGKLAAVQGAEKELVVTDEVGLEYHLSAENGDLLKVVVTEKAKPSFFRRGFAARTPVKRKVRDAPAPRDMGATVMDHSLPMPKRLQALYRIKSAEDCSVRELKSFVLGRKCPHAMREHLIMKLMEIQPGRSVEELFGADSAARRDLQALFARAVVKLGRADDVDYVIPFLHGDGTEAGKRNAQGYVFWMGMKMPDEVLGILRPVWERMADARDQKIACLKSLATGGHMAQFQSLFQEMDRKVLFGDSILRMYLAAAGDEEAMDRTIRKAKRDGSKFYRGREMDLLLKACSDFGLPKRLFPILVDAMEDRPTYINKKSIALLGECDHPDTLKVLQTLYCRVWSGARTPALIRAIEDQTGKCIQEVERSFGGLNLPKVIHFVPRK